jgi:serine/threonine-protein kinase RsbW
VSDVVDLAIPVEADLLVLARLTAATVAARAEFALEELEDLRLVTEELCLSVIGDAASGVVHLRFIRDGGEVTIECSVEPDEFGEPPAPEVDELSTRIIEALVDEHGTATRGSRPCSWIRKRRGTGAG